MPSSMKSSTVKKIVVICADFWTDEFEVDSDVFDDVYIEAATRAIEKRKNEPGFKVTVVLETYEKKDLKKPEKHFCYNTYKVLVNAGLYGKAELLRLNFLNVHGIDLQKESLNGEEKNNGGTSTNNGKPDGTREG